MTGLLQHWGDQVVMQELQEGAGCNSLAQASLALSNYYHNVAYVAIRDLPYIYCYFLCLHASSVYNPIQNAHSSNRLPPTVDSCLSGCQQSLSQGWMSREVHG